MEKENTVPFLDTKVYRDNNNAIKLDWYTKPTPSNRYIHYQSNHSIKIKINFIRQMKSRIIKICHEDYHEKNLKLLAALLKSNGYPIPLINKILYQQQDTKQQSVQHANNTNLNQTIQFAVLPYYNDLTDNFIHILKNENIKFAKRNVKIINSLFTKL